MKKDKPKRDKLKLVNWVNDGYPPIDLQLHVMEVIALVNEIKDLRKKLDLVSHKILLNHET